MRKKKKGKEREGNSFFFVGVQRNCETSNEFLRTLDPKTIWNWQSDAKK